MRDKELYTVTAYYKNDTPIKESEFNKPWHAIFTWVKWSSAYGYNVTIVSKTEEAEQELISYSYYNRRTIGWYLHKFYTAIDINLFTKRIEETYAKRPAYRHNSPTPPYDINNTVFTEKD